MKHIVILSILLFSFSTLNAQVYVSLNSGYAIPSAGVKFGTETNLNGTKNTYGSYGEGLHTQLRAGYSFNEKYALEIALGHLNGADQTSILVDLPNQPFTNIYARGRAYGSSLSLVYNFNKNIYGRFGALIKIGGQTEAIGEIRNIALPAGSLENVDFPTTLDVDFEQHYHGKLPLGFVGAVGYKYHLSTKIALFGELEYMGISIKRNDATMEKFNASLRELPQVNLTVDDVRQIFAATGSPIANVLYNKIDFVDDLPLTNTNGSKQLAEKVPYSSFGFNIGVTYTFGNPKSKD